MSTTDRARSLLAVGMGAIVLGALMIAGFGITSLVTDADVIEQPGLGPVPGVIAFLVALGAWVGVELVAVRGRPGLGSAVVAGVATALAHVLAAFVAALGHGIPIAGGVAGHIVTGGFVIVPLVAGILAATGVAVMLRYSGGTPEWPWEKEDDAE